MLKTQNRTENAKGAKERGARKENRSDVQFSFATFALFCAFRVIFSV
jgi:hypothetical protein